MTGALEETLHGARPLRADQVVELSDDLPADGFGAEHDARDTGGDEQDGRERKERVERKRGAEPKGVVIPPGPQRGSEHWQDRWRTCEHHPSGP